ncbi:MAG: AAA family ATPase [Candidatus Peregrinibacteria bacterium]|nr:AAA family ATPase [Candidatus Peregrinibacteria bacterium]MDZ4244367.1 AAA family ATPase [Candidatus Gracilibacteria bacterium]
MNNTQSHKQIIAFTSAKGGTGQTLIASNMAYLASKRTNTLFIQLTRYPDAHTFFDIDNEKNFTHVINFLENKEDVIKTYQALTYRKNNLSILLSPSNTKELSDLSGERISEIIRTAAMIYGNIIIDLSNDFQERDAVLYSATQIIITSNLDPQSIVKTNQLTEELERKLPQTQKQLIINQTPASISKKDFQSYFKKEVAYTLPFDNEGAWDNIAFSTPYVDRPSKLSKKTETILDKILS